MDLKPATFTLVYECEEGHEQTVECDDFEEVGNYAIEDASMCPECEECQKISYPMLDRIEVNV